MNQSFKFNEDAKYRVGGVYEPTHQFSLVHQTITIKPKRSFDVRLPNIWLSYKLPLVKEAEIYNSWITNQMQFWQNQLKINNLRINNQKSGNTQCMHASLGSSCFITIFCCFYME